MEESIFKLKAAALLQNMVSTEEEVRYNDLSPEAIMTIKQKMFDYLQEFILIGTK